MAIDRSKFKPTSVTKMKETDDATAASVNQGRGNTRPGMLDLTDGKNVFRIFPAHFVDGREEQPPFAQPSVKVFLPAMVDEKDQAGNLTGQKKESQRPVFNSRIHGGTEKDLVEEYIKLARAYAEAKWGDDPKNKAAKGAYLDKVYGKFVKGNKNANLPGLKYQAAAVMYAKKVNVTGEPFGRLEVKKSVKDNMNKIAAEESAGDPMGVDPYTDLDDGRAVVINYNSQATQATDYYRVSLDTDFDKVSKQIKLYPITDEDLEEFSKQPTLESMYVNVFTKKDFELQVAGLEMFDKKNGIGIVETPAYEELVEEIGAYYEETPEDEIEDDDEVEEDDDTNGGDQFDLMSRIELKAFNSTKKLGVVIKTTMTDDVLREAVRAAFANLDIPHVLLPGEEEEENDPPPPAKKKTGNSTLDRIKNLGKK